MYITRFQESGFKPLATFDEDVDVTTGSVPGVTISGDSLATWKENSLNLRSGSNDPINTNAVTLGWNNHIRGDDTTKLGKPASYTIALSDSLSAALAIGRESSIYLSLAPTDAKPGPRAPARDTTKKVRQHEEGRQDQAAAEEAECQGGQGHHAGGPDGGGRRRRRPRRACCRSASSGCRAGRWRFTFCGVADEEQQRFPTQYELVLQTYVMPLARLRHGRAEFRSNAPPIDSARLRPARRGHRRGRRHRRSRRRLHRSSRWASRRSVDYRPAPIRSFTRESSASAVNGLGRIASGSLNARRTLSSSM